MDTENRNTITRRVIAATVGAAALSFVIVGCQTGAVPAADTAPAARGAQVQPVPAGVDADRPADRIDRQIERLQAERAQRFAAMPADRAERILLREAAAVVGWTAGCLQHAVVAAPNGTERVRCVTSR
ncbi:hypothetical protein [Microbacterium aureliae]